MSQNTATDARIMVEENQPAEVEKYGLFVGGLIVMVRQRQVPWTTLRVLAIIAAATLAGVVLSLLILTRL